MKKGFIKTPQFAVSGDIDAAQKYMAKEAVEEAVNRIYRNRLKAGMIEEIKAIGDEWGFEPDLWTYHNKKGRK